MVHFSFEVDIMFLMNIWSVLGVGIHVTTHLVKQNGKK